MKVILHSVNFLPSKEEETDALCEQSCDLLNNKAYGKAYVCDILLFKGLNV
jgi:hypothetical protein